MRTHGNDGASPDDDEDDAADRIRKVLGAQVPPATGRWRPLPGLRFTMPTGGDDRVVAELARTMLSLHAMAAADAYGAGDADVELVLLARAGAADGEATYASHAADERLIAFVRAHAPPAVPAAEMMRLVDAFDWTVERRSQVPRDLYAPVVLVCRARARSILLTNRNPVDAGAQVLTPDACRPTSGFLNVLGTLALRTASAPPDFRIEVNDVDRLLGAGLDPWIRWVHHAVATGSLFDSDRIFVDADAPERYDFRYGDP